MPQYFSFLILFDISITSRIMIVLHESLFVNNTHVTHTHTHYLMRLSLVLNPQRKHLRHQRIHFVVVNDVDYNYLMVVGIFVVDKNNNLVMTLMMFLFFVHLEWVMDRSFVKDQSLFSLMNEYH